MFENGVSKEKKSQIMISDRRFNPKEIQEIIKTAINSGTMLENEDGYFKYLFEYNGFEIIGENFKNQVTKLKNVENDAFKNFRNLEFLNKRAIESYKPIMAFVNYKSSGNSDGWLFYHNRNSEICKQIHYIQIIDLIKDIHSKNLHLINPTVKNFMFDGTRIFLINTEIKKNHLGKIGEYLNFISLKNSAFIFERIYSFKDNIFYKILSKIDKLLHFSKDIPELSVSYFKESKEEFEKMTSKMKKNNKNENFEKNQEVEVETEDEDFKLKKEDRQIHQLNNTLQREI